MARTKEQVDEWVKRMDVSLVFVRIAGVKNERRIDDVIRLLDRPVLSGAHRVLDSCDSEPVSIVEHRFVGPSPSTARHLTAECLHIELCCSDPCGALGH